MRNLGKERHMGVVLFDLRLGWITEVYSEEPAIHDKTL